MQIGFDEKTNEATIKLTINPKSTELSSSKKTFICGQDGAVISVGGKKIRINVLAYSPVEDKAKKSKK